MHNFKITKVWQQTEKEYRIEINNFAHAYISKDYGFATLIEDAGTLAKRLTNKKDKETEKEIKNELIEFIEGEKADIFNGVYKIEPIPYSSGKLRTNWKYGQTPENVNKGGRPRKNP